MFVWFFKDALKTMCTYNKQKKHKGSLNNKISIDCPAWILAPFFLVKHLLRIRVQAMTV